MIKLKQGIFGSAILLASMVLTGCGTSEHPVAIAPSHHSQTVNPSTSTSPSTSSTIPSSSPVSSSPSPTSSPSEGSHTSPTTSSTPTSSFPSNSSQSTTWVFSLSDLEEIYATLSYRSVGPIFPPTAIQQAVRHWEYQASPAMLPYVPQRDASLEAMLIKAIQQYRGRIISSNKTLVKVSSLPGWSFQRDQLPSGNRDFWWPSNNHWPTWITPIKQSL